MKSPFWIINSVFGLVLILIISYAFFSSRQIPSTLPVVNNAQAKIIKQDFKKNLTDNDIKVIYQDNDLFGTFIPEQISKIKALEVDPPPAPPMPKFSQPLPMPTITFMDPLKVSVTGIIMSTNESENQVIISDNATKTQKLYKTGEKIYDAHILRIFTNKVVFIRANGQEETLFVTVAQAQNEINNIQNIDWSKVAQKNSDFQYLIDVQEFSNRIYNLAEFIDQLDLITVFSKGISIGTRIGKMKQNSIGYALGLLSGDIITSINNILATKTDNRVTIYNMLRKLKNGDTIKVEIIRNRIKIELTYTIASIKKSVNTNNPENITIQSLEAQETEKEKLMKEKYKFNNSVQDIKKRDKLAMMRHGSKKSVLNIIPQIS